MLNEYFRNSGGSNKMFEDISSQTPAVRKSARHCKQSNCSATHARWCKNYHWTIFGHSPDFSNPGKSQTISASRLWSISAIKDSAAGIRTTVESFRWHGRKPKVSRKQIAEDWHQLTPNMFSSRLRGIFPFCFNSSNDFG